MKPINGEKFITQQVSACSKIIDKAEAQAQLIERTLTFGFVTHAAQEVGCADIDIYVDHNHHVMYVTLLFDWNTFKTRDDRKRAFIRAITHLQPLNLRIMVSTAWIWSPIFLIWKLFRK